MIELLYFASQIQCGVGGDLLDIQVDIYHNQELIETMEVEEKVLLSVDSFNDLTFEYSIVDNTTDCTSLETPSELVLAPDDALPSMDGFALQDSVETLLGSLNQYQELFLVELGSTDEASSAFDLQDVILRIDNNPVVSNLFAD